MRRVSLQFFPLKLLERSSQAKGFGFEARLGFGGSATGVAERGALMGAGPMAGVHCRAAPQAMDVGEHGVPQGFPCLLKGRLSLFKGDGKGKSGGSLPPFLIKGKLMSTGN